MFHFFQQMAEKVKEECRELIYADWTEDGGAFLMVYRDKEGRKCVISYRQEESHGC